jgi:hypothetical protein
VSTRTSVTTSQWKRPEPSATGPDRSVGGYYRTSDRKLAGKDFRGVPLETTEDAVTAAVRIGYQVLDGQIERGLNMARRLRGAAARAGSTPANVLDDAERLITRGVLLGLEWLETTAAQPGGPLARLVTAQSKMLNALLGVTTPEQPAAHRRTPESAERPGPPEEVPPPRSGPRRLPRIHHAEGSTRRAVSVRRFELVPSYRMADSAYPLKFHSVVRRAAHEMDATLTPAAKDDAVLEVTTYDKQAPGLWRAAVCDSEGMQFAIVEIEL